MNMQSVAYSLAQSICLAVTKLLTQSVNQSVSHYLSLSPSQSFSKVLSQSGTLRVIYPVSCHLTHTVTQSGSKSVISHSVSLVLSRVLS